MADATGGARRDRVSRRIVLFGLPWLVIPLTFIAPGTLGRVVVEVAAVLAAGTIWAVLVLRPSLGPLQRWIGVVALCAAAIALGALLGPGWGVVAVFATTAAAWALPRRFALVVIGALGAVSLLGLLRDGTLGGKLLDVLLPVVIGLAMIALAEFLVLTELVRRQQEDLAAMAVLSERNRIARDLHDSLGHSLMAALVQVRLLRAQVSGIEDDRMPGVLRSLGAVEASVREASGDVRRTVADYRSFDVFAMLETVPSTLRAASISVLVDVRAAAMELLRERQPIADAFGWVLREAATNVLRHSSAESVRIQIRESSGGVGAIELTVVNDGVPPCRAGDTLGGGTGVAGMRARVERIGGTLLVEPSDGTFTLVVRAPLTPEEDHDRTH